MGYLNVLKHVFNVLFELITKYCGVFIIIVIIIIANVYNKCAVNLCYMHNNCYVQISFEMRSGPSLHLKRFNVIQPIRSFSFFFSKNSYLT